MPRPLIELVITDEDLPPDNIEYVDPVEKEEVAQFTDGFEGFIPDEEQRVDDNTIFEIVEEMPEFPGGEAALTRYLATEVKYPLLAQELGIEGRVYVRFVINKNGEVTDITVLRNGDRSLDKEAMRVVSSMPRWKPGKQRNKTVNVAYNVCVNFVLQKY